MPTNTQMPSDALSEAIPVLGFKRNGNQAVISNGGGTGRNAIALTQTVVTVQSDQPVRIAQGTDNSVTATDNDAKLLPNIPYDISMWKQFGKDANGNPQPLCTFLAFKTVGATPANIDINERE